MRGKLSEADLENLVRAFALLLNRCKRHIRIRRSSNLEKAQLIEDPDTDSVALTSKSTSVSSKGHDEYSERSCSASASEHEMF
ncbi:hypothetical protein PoB_006938800 [Plakobranchus ocellatus]|uniref:Uncharacterized protein n=1 Tax=Plakobranchus ocellatus TaxID=259542 RepID=A0AAV4DF72_9GAST|nr:hypothetical protein PoB_006938800 [Plakobranchus ocellatus]